ncbi:hypothetical protein RQP46_007640 [Phenoliferia psychrophenolica]
MASKVAAAATPVVEASWHAAFPTPKSTPAGVTASEVHALLVSHFATSPSPTAKAPFVIVDVRRTDFDVAFIRTAINLPAQSFPLVLPGLIPLLASYPRVIFHCQSSAGRGPRVAAWFQDALDERGIVTSKAEVLVGGIKGWVEKYGEEEAFTVKL